ncbi:MAG: hypothetical protein KDC54_05820 [Lewinella sp.]|nr:hypothetical protein [Lewinella sp.]
MLQSSIRWTFLALLLIGLTACANVTSDRGLITTIDDAIQAEIARSPAPKLNLSEAVNRYWDQVAIIPPRHDPEEAAEALGVDLERVRHTRIEARDDINVIAFLGEGVTVGMVEFPREKADFIVSEPVLLNRDDAIFTILQMPEGIQLILPLAGVE